MTVLNWVVVCVIRDGENKSSRRRIDEFSDVLERLATLNVPPLSYMTNNYSLWCTDSEKDGVILIDELFNVLYCIEISSKSKRF